MQHESDAEATVHLTSKMELPVLPSPIVVSPTEEQASPKENLKINRTKVLSKKISTQVARSQKSESWVLKWYEKKNQTEPKIANVLEKLGFPETKDPEPKSILLEKFNNDFLDVERKPGNLGKAWIIVWIMPIFFIFCFSHIAIGHCYWK